MQNYINDIRAILAKARTLSYTAVNSAMVEAYWRIGERIVLHEQDKAERANYGEQTLKELSKALTAEFGKGFSYATFIILGSST